MWDTLLNTIDNSITPKIAVSRWNGDTESIQLVSQGINLVYRFKKADQVYYLRITHSKLRPPIELESALAFQYHLQQSSVPICHLVSSINNKWIEEITQGEHTFLAHVCVEVPGKSIDFNYTNLLLYEYWGAALAKLHTASIHYQKNKYHYGQWENDIDELNDYAIHENKAIKSELNTVLHYFKNHPQTSKNYGLIHGDHRKDNVLSQDSEIHFIDFDLPRYCWFMDDITRPFFSNIIKKDAQWENKIAPYIKGYRSIFALTDDELGAFSWFIRYKALNIYLWTKNNWKSDVAPGGLNTKEWLHSIEAIILNQAWVKNVNKLIQVLTP